MQVLQKLIRFARKSPREQLHVTRETVRYQFSGKGLVLESPSVRGTTEQLMLLDCSAADVGISLN